MKKTLALIFITLPFFSGCKEENKQTSSDTKTYHFQWASFEQNKIKRFIEEKLVAKANLPAELNFDENEHYRKRNNLEKTIRQLEKAGKEKCDKKLLPADANKSLPESIRNLPGATVITDPAWDKYHEKRSSREYIDCVTDERDSKEIMDLKESLEKENDLRSKQSKFIDNIKRGADDVLRDMVSKYAKANQLDLVILRQTDFVIYNKNDGVLDITNELEAYIRAELGKTETTTK